MGVHGWLGECAHSQQFPGHFPQSQELVASSPLFLSVLAVSSRSCLVTSFCSSSAPWLAFEAQFLIASLSVQGLCTDNSDVVWCILRWVPRVLVPSPGTQESQLMESIYECPIGRP